ncbi:MAG: SpoIIE family protein phosphatase [Oscillospiraceae bacterium]|nr:SpoIIE family protein phosphatase [Oscillospiraceae bacterium]
MKKTSIQKRIFLLIFLSTLVALFIVGAITIGGMLYLQYNTTSVLNSLRETVLADSMAVFNENARKDSEKLISKRSELIDEKLMSWQLSSELLASVAEDIIRNPDSYNENQLDNRLFWLWYAEGTDIVALAPEIGRMGNMQGAMRGLLRGSDISLSFVGTEDGFFISGGRAPTPSEYFDPRTRPWYIEAKEAGHTIWTDVYDDAFGFGLTVTCATPFYYTNGELAGVVGLDVHLSDLDWIISDGKSWESEASFIINRNGEAIVACDGHEELNWDDIWENLTHRTEYIMLLDDILYGTIGHGTLYLTDENDETTSFIIVYTGLNILPWNIVTLISLDEVNKPAVEMQGSIREYIESSTYTVRTVILMMLLIFVLLLLLTAFLSGVVSNRFARSLTKPITMLETNLSLIASGNLDTVIEIKTGDEIESLADSVNSMTVELKDYINNLSRVTAEKERIGAELDVARRIQSGMLPNIFPPFPHREEFDLFACMEPAKEVGGDFYDFYLVNEDTLAVVMADVSGKGIPAALFMVIAKTIIKNTVQTEQGPADVFNIVNKMLLEGNETSMFVTAILGYLDIPTGRFTYVNAGHNPPLIKKADGEFEWLIVKPNLFLAGFDTTTYKQHEVILNPGDEIFLYTDGVTEATDNSLQFYSDPRLIATINHSQGLSPKDLTEHIKNDLDDFTKGAEQADDITMLSLKYLGP